MKAVITQEELHKIFDYREDGNLIWKVNHGNKIKIGDVAGYLDTKRYRVIINKIQYQLHQLIYIYHKGHIDKLTNISRINNNSLDNRIENLILTKDIKHKITQEYLQKLFYYNNGKLHNRISQSGRTINKQVGTLQKNKRRYIPVHGKRYQEHRLIWVYHYGDIPNGLEIDHINRVPDDNRIENLRLVTPDENKFNTNAKGYNWNKRNKKWQARIKINKKSKSLGHFNNEEDARQAYLKAKKEHHIILNRK